MWHFELHRLLIAKTSSMNFHYFELPQGYFQLPPPLDQSEWGLPSKRIYLWRTVNCVLEWIYLMLLFQWGSARPGFLAQGWIRLFGRVRGRKCAWFSPKLGWQRTHSIWRQSSGRFQSQQWTEQPSACRLGSETHCSCQRDRPGRTWCCLHWRSSSRGEQLAGQSWSGPPASQTRGQRSSERLHRKQRQFHTRSWWRKGPTGPGRGRPLWGWCCCQGTWWEVRNGRHRGIASVSSSHPASPTSLPRRWRCQGLWRPFSSSAPPVPFPAPPALSFVHSPPAPCPPPPWHSWFLPSEKECEWTGSLVIGNSNLVIGRSASTFTAAINLIQHQSLWQAKITSWPNTNTQKERNILFECKPYWTGALKL